MTMPDPTPDPAVLSDARAREVLDRIADGPRRCYGKTAVIEAMLAFAKEATPPASDAPASGVGEPVAWCSPGQLANRMDVDADGGVYLPIRKTMGGNFTMPLYAAAPKVASEVAGLREALTVAKRAILKAAMDTLWCDDTPAETVVDRIDALIADSEGPEWLPLQQLTSGQADQHLRQLQRQNTDARFHCLGGYLSNHPFFALTEPQRLEILELVLDLAALTHPAPSGASGADPKFNLATTPGGDLLEQAARYRHVKRGTVYEVVGEAELQTVTGALVDGSALVVYRGDDGKLWAREEGEFHDGRFVALSPARDGAGS